MLTPRLSCLVPPHGTPLREGLVLAEYLGLSMKNLLCRCRWAVIGPSSRWTVAPPFPVHRQCETDARSSLIPFSSQYSFRSPCAKFVPLSVMMLCGRPNLATRSRTNFSAIAPSAFLTGRASIHLVNLSIATRRYSQLPEEDRFSFPTMSKFQTANGPVIGMVLSSAAGAFGCLA